MIVNLRGRFIDTIDKYVINSQDIDASLTTDSIGLIVGIVLISLFLILVVLFLSYCFPCWHLYQFCLEPIVSQTFCNFVNLYDTCCPFLDKKALAKMHQSRTRNRVFVQDMVATSDGRIIQYSDPRPMSNYLSRQSLETHIV